MQTQNYNHELKYNITENLKSCQNLMHLNFRLPKPMQYTMSIQKDKQFLQCIYQYLFLKQRLQSYNSLHFCNMQPTSHCSYLSYKTPNILPSPRYKRLELRQKDIQGFLTNQQYQYSRQQSQYRYNKLVCQMLQS